MTDPGSIAAAYAVVVGGLVLYVASVGRRLRGTRRTLDALRRHRDRDVQPPAARTSSAVAAAPTEPPR